MKSRRVLILGVIGALAVAGLVTAVAWLIDNQQGQAPGLSVETRSRELAAAAVAQLQLDPERAILIALEANAVGHTPQSEDALRRALAASHLRLALPAGARLARWSPDGTIFLTAGGQETASQSGAVQAWELASGRKLFELRGQP